MHQTVTRTNILAGTFRGKTFYTHLKLNISNTYSTKLHTLYILYQETRYHFFAFSRCDWPQSLQSYYILNIFLIPIHFENHLDLNKFGHPGIGSCKFLQNTGKKLTNLHGDSTIIETNSTYKKRQNYLCT